MRLSTRFPLAPLLYIILCFFSWASAAEPEPVAMPTKGICAHRGASDTHPENTIPAFREAIRQGAQMIEFDVALSKDGKLVLLHDNTLDRTTNGSGPVGSLPLAELKKLDAGSWKGSQFKNTPIPTLDEALTIMPENIWLNVHLKGGVDLAKKTTERIAAHQRLYQSFLACGAAAAAAARLVNPQIQICNMERQANSLQYVKETIGYKSEFIQLYGGNQVDPAHTKILQGERIRINFCCANEADKVHQLFKAGVEFPLVDKLASMLTVADQHKIPRLQPIYRSRLKYGNTRTPLATLLEQHPLAKGNAQQGLALSAEHCFSSTSKAIYRYDRNWKLEQEKAIRIEGVNHVGAIHYHDGFIWAGLLHGPENGMHDPKLNRSIIAKIRASDLQIIQTWDITSDVTWIDPVCWDGKHLWVGDMSDLGIHRYQIKGDKMVRDGIFRYPKAMSFSQGLRIRNGKLYSIHTFGSMDGLYEFNLPKTLSETEQQPTRVWEIAENRTHLEGFDFVPGKPMQIWHSQGRQVDRYQLSPE